MEEHNSQTEQLLNDKRVIAEIRRHLWIESEKQGYDIGFEQAKEDWLRKFSKAWMDYHMPEGLKKIEKASPKSSSNKPATKKPKSSQSSKVSRRRAKNYLGS